MNGLDIFIYLYLYKFLFIILLNYKFAYYVTYLRPAQLGKKCRTKQKYTVINKICIL